MLKAMRNGLRISQSHDLPHPVTTDEKYCTPVNTSYWENLYRVSDLGADLTDATDSVTLLLQAKSGSKGRVTLYETEHSGEFTEPIPSPGSNPVFTPRPRHQAPASPSSTAIRLGRGIMIRKVSRRRYDS